MDAYTLSYRTAFQSEIRINRDQIINLIIKQSDVNDVTDVNDVNDAVCVKRTDVRRSVSTCRPNVCLCAHKRDSTRNVVPVYAHCRRCLCMRCASLVCMRCMSLACTNV